MDDEEEDDKEDELRSRSKLTNSSCRCLIERRTTIA